MSSSLVTELCDHTDSDRLFHLENRDFHRNQLIISKKNVLDQHLVICPNFRLFVNTPQS